MEVKDKLWAVLGAQCSSGQGYSRLKIVPPDDMNDPPLQLEADEKEEEKEEESREQCRGVLGNGEEALTCPLCAQ